MSGLRIAALAPFKLLDRYAQRSVDWFMFAVMRATGKSKAAIRAVAMGVEVALLVGLVLEHWHAGRHVQATCFAIFAAVLGSLSLMMNECEEKLASLGGDSTGNPIAFTFRWLWWFFLATNAGEALALSGLANGWNIGWDVTNLFLLYSAQTPPKAPDKQPRRVLVPVRSSL